MSCTSGHYDKEQLHYSYETEIRKYTLLLLILACEVISCLIYTASDTYSRFLTLNNVTNTTVELPNSHCISYNNPALDKVNLFYVLIPYLYGISTIARSAEIFVIAFTIHLMNYIITRIKNAKLVDSLRFFFLTVLSCALIIMTGFIESLNILSLTLFVIFLSVYFCIYIRTSKLFKDALLQRAMERLFQHRANRREMAQYRYSKVTINILCCGYLLIIISDILIGFNSISVSLLFFGNCYFPSNLFPSLSYVLQTKEEVLIQIVKCINGLGYGISYIGLIVIWFPMFCITVYYWIISIRNCFHCNRNIKHRISESSLKYQLINN